MTHAARVPAALLVVVALAGCGGGSKGGTTTLSAAGHRTQATRICEDANRRADALARPRDLGALRTYLDRTLEIVQQDTDRLRRLRPPADLRAGHEAPGRGQGGASRRLPSLRTELDKSKPSVSELQSGLDEVQ